MVSVKKLVSPMKKMFFSMPKIFFFTGSFSFFSFSLIFFTTQFLKAFGASQSGRLSQGLNAPYNFNLRMHSSHGAFRPWLRFTFFNVCLYTPVIVDAIPVSYTHLRAHETR